MLELGIIPTDVILSIQYNSIQIRELLGVGEVGIIADVIAKRLVEV